jgi:hypothetical protein
MRSVLAAVVMIVLTAAPALAQTPAATTTGEPTIAKAPAPWTYYMAIATIGIAGLTLIMAVLGYLVQAPGFRRGQRSGQAS